MRSMARPLVNKLSAVPSQTCARATPMILNVFATTGASRYSVCKPARSFTTWAMKSLRTSQHNTFAAPINSAAQAQSIQVRGMANHRRKKMVKLAKGYRGRAHLYSVAVQRVHKARQYAYRDRKVKKRDFRSLWIQRINAGCRQYNYFPYSVFMNKLRVTNVQLNRKVLADMAVTEPLSFRSVLEVAKASSTIAIAEKKA